MYDHHFSNFGRSPVPDDLCKDSAPRHPLFWRGRFLKVFTTYGHGSHLGQWIATILAIFYSPAPRGSTWNLSNIGQEASEEKSFEILNIFPIQMYGTHTNAYGSKQPCHKKITCQCTTIISATLLDLLSPMICVKIEPQGILSSGEEDF